MTESDLKFHNYFLKNGGLFPVKSQFVTEVLNATKSIFDYLRIKHPKLPEIHCDFIDNDSLNACVGKDINKFYLGINIGCLFLIEDMFSKIMATRSFAPNIGSVKNETDTPKFLNLIIVDGAISFDVAGYTPVYANDPNRLQFGKILTSTVMNFLIFHEIGHIVRGHIGYLFNKHNELNLYEVRHNKGLSPLNSLTMEMDADSFAINHAYIHGKIKIKNPDRLDQIQTLFSQDLKTYLSNLIFSIYCFFKLTEIKVFDLESAENLSHPPPSVRVSLMMNNIASLLIRDKIENIEEIINSMAKSIFEAEKIFESIRYVKDNTTQIFLENYFNSANYQKKIVDNWNNLSPLVKPFSY
ncbi:hypothetical protein [Mucilaginibacter aquariorum]|uniref:Peptidase M48 domain-containing protein n=1 Tax=Mucilaginibacter aquariorum TaxID=2967225 RepID=A0ABT1T4U1_9SPHI|nr:hypothetical protein [Mucilaginibacter aquariorum]MCQ6959569.1 hypothetical protein [Mucilaginibacter aquariorum]